MAETPISRFRLSEFHLGRLDDLAAAVSGGVRTPAIRDCIAYWHRVVSEAGAVNALALPPDDWERLARLNDPGSILDDLEDFDGCDGPVDWSARLAHELVGMWEGRQILPLHAEEAAACRRLAATISEWGVVRGYALYACLRSFWRRPEAGVGGVEWWHPEKWLAADDAAA